MRTLLNMMIAAAMATGATAATGCFISDEPAVEYSAGGAVAYDGSPDLVDVSPGVQVIADYDYPVFFSGGFYWRNYGGYWYSSGTWGGGWGRSYNPPVGIVGISHPEGYAHYRPAGWSPRGGANGRVIGRAGQPTRVETQARRSEQPAPAHAAASHPAPHAVSHKK